MSLGEYLALLKDLDVTDAYFRSEDLAEHLEAHPRRLELSPMCREARDAMKAASGYAGDFWQATGQSGADDEDHLEVVLASYPPGDFNVLLSMPLQQSLEYLSLACLARRLQKR